MKVGLALSGGGILSLAHIGIIRELEKNQIKIDAIAGTSSGAIIAGLYADGGLPRVEAYLNDLDKAGLFKKRNFNLMLPGKVFKELRKCLENNLKAKTFSALPLDFQCAATDISTGDLVMLKKGNLVDAIMASAAYLSVFSPQKIGGKHLVDGGITCNMPAGELRRSGIDFVIGSSLYSVSKINQLKTKKISRIEIALRAIAIMQKELAAYEARECDFCFYPPVDIYRWYSFNKSTEIDKIGEKYSHYRMSKLKALIEEKQKILEEDNTISE